MARLSKLLAASALVLFATPAAWADDPPKGPGPDRPSLNFTTVDPNASRQDRDNRPTQIDTPPPKDRDAERRNDRDTDEGRRNGRNTNRARQSDDPPASATRQDSSVQVARETIQREIDRLQANVANYIGALVTGERLQLSRRIGQIENAIAADDKSIGELNDSLARANARLEAAQAETERLAAFIRDKADILSPAHLENVKARWAAAVAKEDFEQKAVDDYKRRIATIEGIKAQRQKELDGTRATLKELAAAPLTIDTAVEFALLHPKDRDLIRQWQREVSDLQGVLGQAQPRVFEQKSFGLQ